MELLKPVVAAEEGLRLNKAQQETYYNWNAHDLDELKVSDTMCVQPSGMMQNRTKAEVIWACGVQSYHVRTEAGSLLRHNGCHLRKATKSFSFKDNSDLKSGEYKQAKGQEEQEGIKWQ